MLKRYIQAGILNFLTPQQNANQGSYRGKFLGQLTDLVAIVQSYFTAGLITVTGANVSAASTTASGVSEIATLAETVAVADTARVITPSSLAPYQVAIPAAGWTNGGATSSVAITAATHLRGLLPKVYVYSVTASFYTLISSTAQITIANGNLTITIATADVPVSGRIVITQ